MWPDGEGPKQMGPGRSSSGSEVVVISDQVTAAAAQNPVIANMNILRSTGTHIGNKFVTVNQNVHNNDVIKDLTIRQYLVDLVKNSTRAERISCAMALSLVLVGVTLVVVYFTVIVKMQDIQPDQAPHEWRISRDQWLAHVYENDPIDDKYQPIRLVIIQHTVSGECHRFDSCAADLRVLQEYFIKEKDRDIPYNFLVGNDGRVYEGRGWQKEGAHTRFYNLCTVGIGFIGDYREEKGTYTKVTEAQQNRTNLILEEGVRLGYLHKDYLIAAARDVQTTISPGSNLYKAMQHWKRYDHEHRFVNKTCDEINAMPYFQ